ncbi:MAG: hypothetical protein ACRD8A_12450 [Candidatus Acidiferrales bacterium]
MGAPVVSAIASSAVGKIPALGIPVLAVAVLAAGAAILFLFASSVPTMSASNKLTTAP